MALPASQNPRTAVATMFKPDAVHAPDLGGRIERRVAIVNLSIVVCSRSGLQIFLTHV